jgi:hypothetical protein
MNVFLVLAALVALPALGLAIRLVVRILAVLLAAVFVMGLGMLVLLVLAEHVKVT